MALRNSSTAFGAVSKFFHWIIALLIILMIPFGFLMDLASGSLSGLLYGIHKSCGLTLLFLVILMYLWRLLNKRPQYPPDTPVWQAKLANLTHNLLYLFIFIQTLSGWIMSTAAGYPPNFWWMAIIPAPGIPRNPTLAEVTHFIHVYAVWGLIALICLHIVAALYHWWIRRDGIFQRMQPHFTKKKRFYDT